jgi:hypothetical protein
MLLSVSPKYSIANTVGFLKGKSAIRINRALGTVKGSLCGRAFWSRGYCVSTMGLDEAMKSMAEVNNLLSKLSDQEANESSARESRATSHLRPGPTYPM